MAELPEALRNQIRELLEGAYTPAEAIAEVVRSHAIGVAEAMAAVNDALDAEAAAFAQSRARMIAARRTLLARIVRGAMSEGQWMAAAKAGAELCKLDGLYAPQQREVRSTHVNVEMPSVDWDRVPLSLRAQLLDALELAAETN
jgi:hypothetical protein